MKRLFLAISILMVLATSACFGKSESTPTVEVVKGGVDVKKVFLPDVTIKPGDAVTIVTPTPQNGAAQTELSDFVVLDKIQFEWQEGSGEKPMIHLVGSLPTPCHKLRIKMDQVDKNNRINITAFSITNLEQTCMKVYAPFEENIYINVTEKGTYTVIVNGQKAGEFTIS